MSRAFLTSGCRRWEFSGPGPTDPSCLLPPCLLAAALPYRTCRSDSAHLGPCRGSIFACETLSDYVPIKVVNLRGVGALDEHSSAKQEKLGTPDAVFCIVMREISRDLDIEKEHGIVWCSLSMFTCLLKHPPNDFCDSRSNYRTMREEDGSELRHATFLPEESPSLGPAHLAFVVCTSRCLSAFRILAWSQKARDIFLHGRSLSSLSYPLRVCKIVVLHHHGPLRTISPASSESASVPHTYI